MSNLNNPRCPFGLQDRVALITGAGSGIGRASAIRFASAGAHVAVADLDEALAVETHEMIEKFGGRSVPVHCDVASVPSVEAMIDTVAKEFGALDALFNNAGASAPMGMEASESEWSQAIDVNLKSGYFVTKAARPLLERSGHASVIFTSSISGLVAAPSVCYSAAKGGTVTLARSLAVLLAPHQIRVNVICPGPIETATLADSMTRQGDSRSVRASIVARVPMARLGTPDEIATVAQFLASDASSFLTGGVLPVDGGYTAQ